MTDSKFFYANSIAVGRSTTDFTVILQQRGLDASVLADGQSEPRVMDQLHVGLSPAHAKLLAANLSHSVAMYEKEVGIIPLAQVDREKFDELVRNTRHLSDKPN